MFMKKYVPVLSLLIFVFACWACVPVPVPVGGTTTVYDESYGYEEPYGYDEYVDVPVVYGEPMYYAPPVSVTFAFDYFTYEAIGGFVDVVFWRGGNRYHREPWYEQGRRITDRDIRSGTRYHKVRGKEFYNHREKLRSKHNIVHPDSYYKLQRSKQKEQQRRLEEQKKRELEMRKQREKQRLEEDRNRYNREKRELQEKQRRLEEQKKRELKKSKEKEKRLKEHYEELKKEAQENSKPLPPVR